MLSLKRLAYKTNQMLYHGKCCFAVNPMAKFHKFETIVREREIACIPSEDPVMGIIEEMKQFVNEFNDNENMEEFFTRKSNQNVLSVVQCFYEDKYLYFRGRNIEVSLPSGTLCGERSAIGNATSNNLNLHRKHFKRIAVIDPDFNIIGLGPCGVCKEYLQKFQEESAEFCIITFPDSEFKSIYEHFPANYPVENVDSEETQQLLDKKWKCNCCNSVNSGYSTNCYHCGYAENAITKKTSKPFQNPLLTLDVVDAIYNNFYPNSQFLFQDLMDQMGPDVNRIDVNNLFSCFADPTRHLLTSCGKRKGKIQVWQVNAEPFKQYRESLRKNVLANIKI